MSEIEAVGDLAQGGLTARAIEPVAGEQSPADKGHTREAACLNCGTPLVGSHCHHCGQRAHVHRTLSAFFHDLLHGVLHFEGKVWRTLPLLAWRPGKLTREYIDGRRASYVSPIALFLFTIFVTFALWSALGGVGEINNLESEIDQASAGQFEANIADMDAEIAQLEEQLGEARSRGTDIGAITSELEGKRKARRIMAGIAGDSAPSAKAPEAAAGETTATEKKVGNWLNRAWLKAKADPALLLYKLQTNAYKLSWLLIPLSLPFLWLVFPFSRRFRMYDHTVFVTYSISFMTMLIVVASLGGYLGFAPLVIVPLLYAPLHLYRHLRGAYDLTRFGAIWRLLVLSVVIYLVLTLFILIMLGLVIN